MKRILFLVVIPIILSCHAEARIRFGAEVGGTISNVRFPPSSMKVGFYVAGCVQLKINDLFCINTALQFSQKGYNDRMKGLDELGISDNQYSVTSSYVELPVAVTIYPIKNAGLNVFAGPQIGCLVHRCFSPTAVSQFYNPDNIFDCGINFGFGYELGHFSISCKYYLGLANTYRHTKSSTNRSFLFGVGYNF